MSNKTRPERAQKVKYQLLNTNELFATSNTDDDANQKRNHQAPCAPKDGKHGVDDGESPKNDSMINEQVFNPLFEYPSPNQNNNNNYSHAKSRPKTTKMTKCPSSDMTHKRHSFLNILTRTIKNFVNKNQKHMQKNTYCEQNKNTPKYKLNNNTNFLIDDIEMSLHDNNQVQLKLLMPRQCFDDSDTNLELNKHNTRSKSNCVASTRSDSERFKRNYLSKYNHMTCSASNSRTNTKMNGHRYKKSSALRISRSENSNGSNSRLKKCVSYTPSRNDCINSSSSSSPSSCDLAYDNANLKWRISREISKRRCLIFLCFVSIFLNPFFGKSKKNQNLNSILITTMNLTEFR